MLFEDFYQNAKKAAHTPMLDVMQLLNLQISHDITGNHSVFKIGGIMRKIRFFEKLITKIMIAHALSRNTTKRCCYVCCTSNNLIMLLILLLLYFSSRCPGCRIVSLQWADTKHAHTKIPPNDAVTFDVIDCCYSSARFFFSLLPGV